MQPIYSRGLFIYALVFSIWHTCVATDYSKEVQPIPSSSGVLVPALANPSAPSQGNSNMNFALSLEVAFMDCSDTFNQDIDSQTDKASQLVANTELTKNVVNEIKTKVPDYSAPTGKAINEGKNPELAQTNGPYSSSTENSVNKNGYLAKLSNTNLQQKDEECEDLEPRSASSTQIDRPAQLKDTSKRQSQTYRALSPELPSGGIRRDVLEKTEESKTEQLTTVEPSYKSFTSRTVQNPQEVQAPRGPQNSVDNQSPPPLANTKPQKNDSSATKMKEVKPDETTQAPQSLINTTQQPPTELPLAIPEEPKPGTCSCNCDCCSAPSNLPQSIAQRNSPAHQKPLTLNSYSPELSGPGAEKMPSTFTSRASDTITSRTSDYGRLEAKNSYGTQPLSGAAYLTVKVSAVTNFLLFAIACGSIFAPLGV